MSYIVIPVDGGYVTHTNVNPDVLILPDAAEIYEEYDEYEERLEELTD